MQLVKGEKNALSYFQNMIAVASYNQNFQMDESLRFYLAALLANYLRTENLCPSNVGSLHEPFVLILKRASESERFAKYKLLKHVGDLSLYITGFFSESLTRKPVGIDYYISMGKTAYEVLATDGVDFSSFTKQQDLFVRLSKGFQRYVSVLNEVSEKTNVTSNTDILRLYERWLKTKCERIAQHLRRLGIYPNKVKSWFEH